MNLSPFIDSELTPIKLILDEIPGTLAAKASQAPPEGPYTTPLLTDAQAYLLARELILQCALYQLNALVDGSLLALANHLRDGALSLKDMGRSRTVLLTEIEQALDTKAGLHPGWDQVQRLRDDVNALKHRAGFIFGEGTDFPLTIVDDIRPTPQGVLERFVGTRTWLASVADLVAARPCR